MPISSLFHDDAGPHVVSASGSPPTSASARFRLELVSQGEHLERLAQEARTAHDDAASERFRRELRRALRGVRGLAESFEEREVVALSGDFLNAGIFDAATLDRLSRMAALLADPALDREALDARLRELSQPEAPEVRPTPAAAPTVPAPAPVPTPAASAPAVPTPTLLERGLAGLALLEAEPLGAPAPMAEQPPVVPIETLLYRGRAAVRRAIELRDEMRRGGGAPTPEVVEELFDLMELALLDEAVA